MSDCRDCKHRKDYNDIIQWNDPSRMFTNWKCFYNMDSSFESVKDMNEKDIPDLRYDLYNHKWITVNFSCPIYQVI